MRAVKLKPSSGPLGGNLVQGGNDLISLNVELHGVKPILNFLAGRPNLLDLLPICLPVKSSKFLFDKDKRQVFSIQTAYDVILTL